MPEHDNDSPTNQTRDEQSPPAAPGRDAEPEPPDEFTSLPRKRFWRGREPKAAAVEPWWQRPEETDPEG